MAFLIAAGAGVATAVASVAAGGGATERRSQELVSSPKAARFRKFSTGEQSPILLGREKHSTVTSLASSAAGLVCNTLGRSRQGKCPDFEPKGDSVKIAIPEADGEESLEVHKEKSSIVTSIASSAAGLVCNTLIRRQSTCLEPESTGDSPKIACPEPEAEESPKEKSFVVSIASGAAGLVCNTLGRSRRQSKSFEPESTDDSPMITSPEPEAEAEAEESIEVTTETSSIVSSIASGAAGLVFSTLGRSRRQSKCFEPVSTDDSPNIDGPEPIAKAEAEESIEVPTEKSSVVSSVASGAVGLVCNTLGRSRRQSKCLAPECADESAKIATPEAEPEEFMEAPGAEIHRDVVTGSCSIEDACLPSQSGILAHGLRGFLNERSSGNYLSVVEGASSAVTCVLTEKAVSLLICCSTEEPNAESPIAVSLEHEGLPAFGRFLSCKPPRFTRGRPKCLPLKCAGRGHSGAEVFVHHSNLTIEHRPTGLWLCVEPGTQNIILHATGKSEWEFLPAL